eukprot:scaffold14916_cov128-Isochrysis_galbana.AAC.18
MFVPHHAGAAARAAHASVMFPSAFAVVVAAAQASALARARAVAAKAPPEVTNGSRVGGEHEAAAWWEEHDALFGAARAEWGPKHSELYDFDTHEDDFIDPGLRAAVRAAESAAAAGLHVDEEILRAHLHPTNVPGVYRLRLFTPRFCRLLLEELRHVAESGVPIRRPNGMNRFGAILEAVPGGLHMEWLAARIALRYARPLAQMAFPHLVGAGDASEHFGFVVDYRQGGDESLALHADASVATLNVRLGNQPFEGGQLCFRGLRMVDDQPREVAATCLSWDSFEAGEAILHL